MCENKRITLTIASVLNKMKKGTILFNHPLQRLSGMWTNEMVGNLISDILQKNPIPALIFAEQFVNGVPIIWDIDGKQRCTNIELFVENQTRVSKKVRRYMIEYYVPVLDENGKQLINEELMPIFETKTFDIRGKRFNQLPKELQEMFLDYHFDIVQYLDCTADDIAYHITRYNDGKPMNAPQKGITKLGAYFAEITKEISDMDFFKKPVGKYTYNQMNNGSVNRVVIESVMASRYLNEWNKDYGTICNFLKNNAMPEDFDHFEKMVERLEESVTEEVGKMFDSTNSFIYFALFNIFMRTKRDDEDFVEFLSTLNKDLEKEIDERDGLCADVIDGVSYNDLLETRDTKSKVVITAKIEHLSKLMCCYLGIDENEIIAPDNENFDDFSMNFVSDEVAAETLLLTEERLYKNFEKSFDDENIKNIIEWCKLNGLKKMFNECLVYKKYISDAKIDENDKNLPFYISAVKYIIDNNFDIDIVEWLKIFSEEAFWDIDTSLDNTLSSKEIISLKEKEFINNIKYYFSTGG